MMVNTKETYFMSHDVVLENSDNFTFRIHLYFRLLGKNVKIKTEILL
jgi:hypothetical protein